ncbi:Ribosomal protein S8 [Rhodotorula toruloides]|nr:Ribosomal protein S8 [Rhodotorula toruloides]
MYPPCRGLQPSIERLRYREWGVSDTRREGGSWAWWLAILRARPEVGQYCQEFNLLATFDSRTGQVAAEDEELSLDDVADLCRAMPNLTTFALSGPRFVSLLPVVLSTLPRLHIVTLREIDPDFWPPSLATRPLPELSLEQPTQLRALEIHNKEFGEAFHLEMSTMIASRILDIVRASPLIETLILRNTPGPEALNDILDAHPNSHLLQRLYVDIQNPRGPPERNGPDYVGESWKLVTSLSRYIQSLPGLETLIIGKECTVFDERSVDALKARKPLRTLAFKEQSFGYSGDTIHDLLPFLKTLSPSHLPRHLVLDYDISGSAEESILDWLPVYANEEFPTEEEVYGDGYRRPKWWHDGSYEEVVRIKEFGDSVNLRMSGRIFEGLPLKPVRDEDLETYNRLRVEHERKRKVRRSV